MRTTRRQFLRGSLGAAPILALASSLSAQSLRRLSFRLGVITDEISDDLDVALDFISNYRLPGCELRDIWGKNIMYLSPQDLAAALHLVRNYNKKVSDIASPIFKYNLPQMPARKLLPDRQFGAAFSDKDSDSLLLKSFNLARFFGTNKVRIFSYWRVQDPEKAYPYVRDRLAKAAELAGKNDILLVLENEMDCNVGTGKELGRILRDINSPHLRGNWDPGNAVMLGEVPYPDGYNYVKGLFAHMHVKDARRNPATRRLTWAPVGAGVIDWKGQIKAVIDSHYDGTMSLETHYRRADGNRVESSRESLLGLLKIIREEQA